MSSSSNVSQSTYSPSDTETPHVSLLQMLCVFVMPVLVYFKIYQFSLPMKNLQLLFIYLLCKAQK